jgi:hypothetical protein
MKRFLILWLLATSIITQGFGQGTPKPTVFTIVPKANVSGLNKTLDSLKNAIGSAGGSVPGLADSLAKRPTLQQTNQLYKPNSYKPDTNGVTGLQYKFLQYANSINSLQSATNQSVLGLNNAINERLRRVDADGLYLGKGYTPPIGSATTPGLVKGSENVQIDSDGTLRVTAPGSVTLADVNPNPGRVGASNVIPIPTFDTKGRATKVESATITPGSIGAAVASDVALQLLLKTDILSAAQLRATGTIAQYVNLTDAGKRGTFYYDPSDTTTPDDGGATCVVSSGKRYKYYYTGPLEATRFGNLGTGADDAPSIMAALNSSAPEIILPPGRTYSISRVLVPAYKRLIISLGATVKYLPLSSAQISSYGLEYAGLELGDGAALGGRGRIDGNKANRSQGYGIFAANTVGGAAIEGITVFNMSGDNIRMQHVDGGVTIRDVNTFGGDDRGLHIITTSDVTIDNYRHDGGTHGIQGWGDNTRYCERWSITNTKVRNGTGAGFWVNKARGWTCTALSAEFFGDLLFDFEETFNSTFSNVYGKNGIHGGIAVYNGCENDNFNVVEIIQEQGYGPGYKGFANNNGKTNKNKHIAINGGSITTHWSINPISTDGAVDPKNGSPSWNEDLQFNNVKITGGYSQMVDVLGSQIRACTFTTNGGAGLWVQGGKNAVIEGNIFNYVGTGTGANEIRITWRSNSEPATGARVAGNHAYGFTGGMWDDPFSFENTLTSSGSMFTNNETAGPIVNYTGDLVNPQRIGYTLRFAGNYRIDGSPIDMGYRQDLNLVTTGSGGFVPFLTLPPTSGGSLDNAVVGVTLGGWAGNSKKHYTLRVGQREGLVVNLISQGDNSSPGSVVAYRQTDNSTIFYASVGTFAQVGVDYRQLTQATGVPALTIQTATPTGTKVYDSGTTPPNFEITQSGVKANGTLLGAGSSPPSGAAGGSLSGNYPNPGIATQTVKDIAKRPESFEYWHDILAFGYHTGNPTFEQRISGSWVDKPAPLTPFTNKENISQVLVAENDNTMDGARYTWHNGTINYSLVENIVIGINYTGNGHTYNVKVETSVDGSAWTQKGVGSTTNSAETMIVAVPPIGEANYLRLTFEVVGNGTSNGLRVNKIQAITARKGDQGAGSENQYPFRWEADRTLIVKSVVTEAGGRVTADEVYSNQLAAPTTSVNSIQSYGGGPTVTVGPRLKVSQGIEFPDGKIMTTVPVATTGGSYSPSYAGSALIIVDFNSLGAGRGSSHEISNPDDYSPGPFPYTMMNTLAAQFPSATFAKKNFSVSGRQTPTMIANSGQVDAQFNPALFDRQIIVAGEITNHIADGGATAQQAIDSYVAYCKARRAKGFLVVATPVLPRESFFGSGMSIAEFASRRAVVNDYLKLHYLEFADVFADLNTIPDLTYPDKTHTDDAGYIKIGNFIAGKVAPLLVTGFNPQSIAFLLSGTTTTPPSSTTTAPSTGTVTAGTVLMIAGTGSDGSTNITDATGKTISRVGNPVISTAQSQFGGSSIYFDGNSFLTIPTSSDFDFGTGDFTVELFARPTELVRQYGGLISRGDETDNQWTFSYNGSSTSPDLFIRQNGSYGNGPIAGSSSGLTLNAWQHVALVRKSNVVKVYVNGNVVGTGNTTLSMETMNTSKRINIGAFPTPNTAGSPEQEKFKGYVQGIRITKGTARYDGNFTPPTSY